MCVDSTSVFLTPVNGASRRVDVRTGQQNVEMNSSDQANLILANQYFCCTCECDTSRSTQSWRIRPKSLNLLLARQSQKTV